MSNQNDPGPTLDVNALYVALDKQRRDRKTHWRDVANHVGVSASTFSRMAYGNAPNATALIRMLAWLGTTDIGPYVQDQATDVTVFDITPEQWQAAAARQLAELGLSWDEMRQRHEYGILDHRQTKWWMMFGCTYEASP